MDLAVKTRTVNEAVVIELVGRLWILDLPLRDLIKKMLDEGKRHFVLNLANVSYVDSSGLGQMLAIWTSIKSQGGFMTLLRPSDRVQTLLTITKLGSVFQIFEDESSAVTAAVLGGSASSFGISA